MHSLAEDFSLDPTLTPLQHRIITLLASGSTITKAAETEGVHRNTIANWRRTDCAFARELEFATREQRLYWHEQATALAPQALEAIEACLTDPNTSPSLKFRAAALILKMATDPQAKPLQSFPNVAPEIEAIEGKILAIKKELVHRRESRPEMHKPAQSQECTTVHKPQPIRVAPQPGRNAQCPCHSGLKYKRCCANKLPAQREAA
jgi:transposase-like protein